MFNYHINSDNNNVKYIKEVEIMHKISGFMKGMATGLVVGAAVTMIADPMTDRDRHKIAKKTEGIFKNIGSVIDTTLGMMH